MPSRSPSAGSWIDQGPRMPLETFLAFALKHFLRTGCSQRITKHGRNTKLGLLLETWSSLMAYFESMTPGLPHELCIGAGQSKTFYATSHLSLCFTQGQICITVWWLSALLDFLPIVNDDMSCKKVFAHFTLPWLLLGGQNGAALESVYTSLWEPTFKFAGILQASF